MESRKENLNGARTSRVLAVTLSLGLPLLVHLLLTLWNRNAEGLWLDEAYGVLLSRLPVTALPEYLKVDSGPPLLYAFFHILRTVWAETVAMYRAPALVAGILGLIAVWHIGRTWRGIWTGGFCAALWAASPLIVHYEREARIYTTLAFVTLIHIWALQRLAAGRGKTRHTVGLSLALCLGLYGHNFGWFLIPGAWLALILCHAPRGVWRLLVLAQGAAGLLYLPWLPILAGQFGETERTIGWIGGLEIAFAPIKTFLAFIPGGRFEPFAGGPGASNLFLLGSSAVLTVAGLLACVFTSVPFDRARIRKQLQEPGFRVIAGLGIVLVGGPLLASWLIRPMVLPGRTDVIAYPCFVLLLGAGCAGIRIRPMDGTARWPRLLILTFLVVLGIAAIVPYLQRTSPSGDRHLASLIRRNVKPGDVVLFTGLSRPTVESYLFMNREPDISLLSWPPDMAVRLAHLNDAAYLQEPGWPGSQIEVLDKECRARLGPEGRILVLDSPRKVNEPLRAYLKRYLLETTLNTKPVPLRRLGEPFTVKVYKRVPSEAVSPER